MRIGIDARLWHQTGVGRYIRNLVASVGNIDTRNTYIIFLNADGFDEFIPPNSRWEKRLVNIPWHGFSEQICMPWHFYKAHLDLVHIPYFNVPLLYFRPFIVTIHDLTILKIDTGRATTLPFWQYALRRIGYKIVLRSALKRAKKILTVSETTKEDIESYSRVNSENISVTYEGVDIIRHEKVKLTEKTPEKQPYFLTVGNAYPHKNLERLLLAFHKFISRKKFRQVMLLIVGREDFFTKRLRDKATMLKLHNSVSFLTHIPDSQLVTLYRNARALVFPSLAEGFGLPGVEALSLGCPVVCSDIPVFREILKDNALYFDPLNTDDMCNKLEHAFTGFVRPDPMVNPKYSWELLARTTLAIYEHSTGLRQSK